MRWKWEIGYEKKCYSLMLISPNHGEFKFLGWLSKDLTLGMGAFEITIFVAYDGFIWKSPPGFNIYKSLLEKKEKVTLSTLEEDFPLISFSDWHQEKKIYAVTNELNNYTVLTAVMEI